MSVCKDICLYESNGVMKHEENGLRILKPHWMNVILWIQLWHYQVPSDFTTVSVAYTLCLYSWQSSCPKYSVSVKTWKHWKHCTTLNLLPPLCTSEVVYWPLSTAKSSCNRHLKITVGPWSNAKKSGIINHFLFYFAWMAEWVSSLPEEEMEPGLLL